MKLHDAYIKKFFEPFRLRDLDLKNRVVMAPMTRKFSKDGVPGANVAEYYKDRSSVGLIITEGAVINHPSANGYEDVPYFYGPQSLARWKKVVDAVHKKDGKIFPQLWHVGNLRRLGTAPDPKIPGFGPMGKVTNGKVVIKAMTKRDIQEVIQAFREAASTAKVLGFDGVEIHGAHGYLIDQFLYEESNQRIDEYGGNLEKRARFAREVIEAIRDEVGEDFPISFRFSQWKIFDFDAKLVQTPKMLEELLKILSKAGVDIFHCSTRRFWEPPFEGSGLTLAGWTKKFTGKPTIAVGDVGVGADFFANQERNTRKEISGDLVKLHDLMARGELDLFAVGRSLVANPDWPLKVKEGRYSDLAPYHKNMLSELL